MIRFTCYLLLSATLSACIEPIDVNTEVESALLVVEGFITDEPGPHTIRLSRLAKFAGELEGGNIEQEDDAEIFIEDDLGTRIEVEQQVEIVSEIMNLQTPLGLIQDTVEIPIKTIYTTPEGFRGEIGRTYVLNVRLLNGRMYQSTPQTILPAPELDSLIFSFVKLPSADEVTFTSGLEVYSRWQDPPGEENYYIWVANTGTYQLISRPDQYIDPVTSTPAPKGCCAVCYVPDNLSQIIVHSDLRTDGAVQTVLSAFIEDDGIRLKDRYLLEVNMFTVTKEAFAFHRLVQSQLSIQGSILDPPPGEITGNITNVSDPQEVVIGFFGAYNSSQRSRFISPSDLEEPQRQVVLPDDCRTISRSSTDVPTFWNN